MADNPNKYHKDTLNNMKQSCFGFDKRSPYISEYDSIKDLLSNPDFAETDALSEGKNDQYLKSEDTPEIEKTAILTFDDNKTKLKTSQLKSFHFDFTPLSQFSLTFAQHNFWFMLFFFPVKIASTF